MQILVFVPSSLMTSEFSRSLEYAYKKMVFRDCVDYYMQILVFVPSSLMTAEFSRSLHVSRAVGAPTSPPP